MPKYSIGQHVYYVTLERDKSHYQCPDCVGSGAWKAIAPSGYETAMVCPRCKGRKTLDQETKRGMVRSTTIGAVIEERRENGTSVRYATRHGTMEEASLFALEKCAEDEAKRRAAEKEYQWTTEDDVRRRWQQEAVQIIRDVEWETLKKERDDSRMELWQLVCRIGGLCTSWQSDPDREGEGAIQGDLVVRGMPTAERLLREWRADQVK